MISSTPPEQDKAKALLATSLQQAIENDDEDGIRLLLQQGADPGTIYHRHPSNFVRHETPAWYAIRAGKSDYLSLLLGSNRGDVPLALHLEKEGSLNLLEAMVYHSDQNYLGVALPDLMLCLDTHSPEVSRVLWSAAEKIINNATDAPTTLDQCIRAATILKYGGICHTGERGCLDMLTRPVQMYDNDPTKTEVMSAFASVSSGDKIIGRMIEAGLSANARIDDVPLLHFAAAKNHSAMAQALIEAGARLDSTCSPEAFNSIFKIEKRTKRYACEDMTAAATAQYFGSQHTLPLLLAAAARQAMNAALRPTAAQP